MKQLSEKSRASIEFELEWKSRDAHHIDGYWADPVNFWRDYFDPSLFSAFLNRKVGDKITIDLPQKSCSLPFSKKKVIEIKPCQFQSPDKAKPIVPRVGRFYPQGVLHGVDGVFKGSIAPCRFVGRQNGSLFFDLNHPLSPYNITLHAFIRQIHDSSVERGGRCEDWLEKISLDGPGMQGVTENGYDDFFTQENFKRKDGEDDSVFYSKPRFVHHLDSYARESITGLYRKIIGRGSEVLDLMASWNSHLSEDMDLKKLAVLGLNLEELAQNSMATEKSVQNLNTDKILPYNDNSFEAVICSASVEYLTDPVAIFKEVNRILRSGAVFVLTFSNRWFPPKAVNIWTEMHEFERLGFVLEIFRKAGNFTDLHTYSRRGLPRPEDDPHWEEMASDPVYAVWGTKK